MKRNIALYLSVCIYLTGCGTGLFTSVESSGWKGLVQYQVTCGPCDPSKANSGGGTGTLSDPYLVCSADQLKNIDTQCSTRSGWTAANFVQCADLDLKGTSANPSSPVCLGSSFKGSYNGAGFTIKNFYYNNAATDNVGVFATLSGASISNLTLKSPVIHGGNKVGGIAGEMTADASITSCVGSQISIQGAQHVGGLVGKITSDTCNTGNVVTGSSTSGAITSSDNWVGGLVGSNTGGGSGCQGIISYSSSSTLVTTTGDIAGGLIGYVDTDGHISHSYATGAVSGGFRVGGLIGFLDGNPHPSYLSDSFATGTATASGDAAGGLVGMSDFGVITNSYSTGNAVGTNQVGGFVGAIATCSFCTTAITSSYSTGSATGTSQVGGFVGLIDDTVLTLSNSYSTGSATGTSSTGGFMGELTTNTGAASTISNSYSIGAVSGSGGGFLGTQGSSTVIPSGCFWDKTTSGQTSSTAGTGKTTSEMKTTSTFAGWPTLSATDWTISSGSYPKLKW